MAERRMFHSAVVESDAFLDMPAGAQALYFHLCMHADDDGFINGPRQVARKLRRPPRELQLLCDNGFLINFDGIVVVKHWRVANSWKSDRLQLPRYPELAQTIYIKDTKEYTLVKPRKGKNLLQIKKDMIRDNGIQGDSQKRREKKKREEKKIEENNQEEVKEKDGFLGGILDGPDKPDFAAATEEDTVLNFMKGKLGKGVVLLSEAQQADLLEKMDIDSFDYYVARLADFILTKQARVKNHYATILKWWDEDRRLVE